MRGASQPASQAESELHTTRIVIGWFCVLSAGLCFGEQWEQWQQWQSGRVALLQCETRWTRGRQTS